MGNFQGLSRKCLRGIGLKAYQRKICGANKSRKNGYFRVPDENRIREFGQLEDPGKLRIMLHIAAAHLNEGESVSEGNIEIVNI